MFNRVIAESLKMGQTVSPEQYECASVLVHRYCAIHLHRCAQ